MLEDQLIARDRWSREDLLAYQRERVQALPDHTVNRSSTGAVPPVVEMQPVTALPRGPAASSAAFDRRDGVNR